MVQVASQAASSFFPVINYFAQPVRKDATLIYFSVCAKLTPFTFCLSLLPYLATTLF